MTATPLSAADRAHDLIFAASQAEDAGDLDAAAAGYRAATEADPSYYVAWRNWGLLEMRRRRVDAAAAALSQAARCAPDRREAASMRAHLAGAWYGGADQSPRSVIDNARAWGRDVAALAAQSHRPPRRRPAPGLAHRPLRVGVWVENAATHGLAMTLRPLLAGLAAWGVSPRLYCDRNSAAASPLFQFNGAVGINVDGASVEQAEAWLAQDQIDVLLSQDPAILASCSRIFARDPAPLTVNFSHALLSYDRGVFDAMVCDLVTLPPDQQVEFKEDLFFLNSYISFDCREFIGRPPIAPAPITLGHSPCFGSFNRPNKVNAPTAAFWAAALRAVPQARLLLNNEGYGDPNACARVMALLAAGGIDAARVELRPGAHDEAGFLSAYGDVDLSLDVVGLSGGLTTLDALWQGVPTLTVPPPQVWGRATASFMTSLGLADLCIALSPEEAAAKAAALLAHPDRLARLRQTMRERAMGSPLFAYDHFAGMLLDECRRWLLSHYPEAA